MARYKVLERCYVNGQVQRPSDDPSKPTIIEADFGKKPPPYVEEVKPERASPAPPKE